MGTFICIIIAINYVLVLTIWSTMIPILVNLFLKFKEWPISEISLCGRKGNDSENKNFRLLVNSWSNSQCNRTRPPKSMPILTLFFCCFLYILSRSIITTIIVPCTFCMMQTALTTARLTKHMPSSIFHSLCVNAKVGVFTKAEGMTSFLEYAAQRDTPQCHRKLPRPLIHVYVHTCIIWWLI